LFGFDPARWLKGAASAGKRNGREIFSYPVDLPSLNQSIPAGREKAQEIDARRPRLSQHFRLLSVGSVIMILGNPISSKNYKVSRVFPFLLSYNTIC
jgi:hypothetical protein